MKQKRAFVKRMLTFVLCLAMVFTSVNVPTMTVMAAENVTDSETTVSETDTEVVETTVEETVTTTEEAVSEEVTETVEEATTVVETEEVVTEEITTEEVTTETATEEETTTEEVVTVEAVTMEETVTEEEVVDLYDFGDGNEIPELAAGYETIFLDEFNGSSLDTESWNREQRQPGWTNQELQEYTDSEDNSFVADGKLVLQAHKTKDANGNDYYTSGKVTTKNKVDFTYGKVEASIRVPSGGQGMWPAFWMMPTNEQFYGTWPKCGEIDIMEVLGHEPEKAYQTLHWGDPHGEKQGTMVLKDGETFADDYHIFAVEWLPGEIIYTIDGIETHRVTDWYTKVEGGDEATFPAPFDQDFFLQLNLAVGGTWPGNPDSTTVFGEGSQMAIDWVRVSQKSDEAYQAILDELEQPDRTVILREPDANGNYIVNGNFAVEEALDESDAISAGADWVFLTAEGGTGTAAIDTTEGMITIDTTNESASEHNQTYAIQLVQPGIPMEQGKEYKLSFQAKAEEARTMIVDISNTSSWSRYLADTTLDLTTDWKDYEYTFTVTTASDANARLEFNLGKQNSVATAYLKNVKLVQTGNEIEIEESATTADGNYVRNGGFEVGEGRLSYWTVNTGETGASVSVTNKKDTVNKIYVRELKTVGAEGLSANDVTVSQADLALAAETTYAFAMDAYAEKAATINVKVAGVDYPVELTTEKQTFVFDVTTPAELTDTSLVLGLGSETAVYVDNISVKDKSLIINGSFDNGMSGWTPYSYLGDVKWEIVKDAGNNVMKYTIPDTGNTDWYIQLKQHNVNLEQGKKYKLTFRAKANVLRDIQFAFQRDGAIHKNEDGSEDWTPYSKTEIVTVGKDDKVWDTFSTIFEMTEPTDATTIMGITMGAVGGKQVAELHEIYLDDFVLEETDEEIPDDEEENTAELIKNGDFSAGGENWGPYVNTTDATAPAEATYEFNENGAVFTITNVGGGNYFVQLKQTGLKLEKDKTYDISMTINSDQARHMYYAFSNASYQDYMGWNVPLNAGEDTVITQSYTFTSDTDSNVSFGLNLGANENDTEGTPAGVVTIKSVSIIAKDGVPEENPTPTDGEMIKNGDFASGKTSWEDNCGVDWVDATATSSYSENGAVFDITNVGTANWHVQLKQPGVKLEQGKEYTLKMVVASEKTRDLEYSFMDTASAKYYGGSKVSVTASDVSDPAAVTGMEFTHTFKMEQATDANAVFIFSMGKMDDTTEAGRVVVKSVSLKEKSEEGPGEGDEEPVVKEGLRIEKIADQTYTGKAIKPAVVVYDGETLLVEKKDYTVKYSANVKVGTATVKVTGKGNYVGSDTANFTIVKKNLGDADITAADVSAVVKNNKVKDPKVVVKMGKTTLKENRDYVLERPTIQKNKDGSIKTGQYEIKIVAKEDSENAVCNFTGSRTIIYEVVDSTAVAMKKVTVKAASISYADYLAGERPVVTVTSGKGAKKVDLVAKALCKIEYPDEVTVGKNNVITVSPRIGSGFYGTKTVKFTVTGEKINAKNIAVTVSANNFTYTGEEIRYGENGIDPVVVTKTTKTTVSGNEVENTTVLTEGVDYKLVYKNNVKAGKATVSVVGINGYTGKKDVKFTISKADVSVSGNVIAVEPIADQVYTGKALTPALDVTVNDIPLTVKKDYTVKYAANKNVGTATATVTLKGNFKGSVKAEFKVIAKPLSDADIAASDVYAVLDKNGNLKNPKVTVKMGKTTLKANRDYVVDWDNAVTVSGNTVSGNGLAQAGSYIVPIKAVDNTETTTCNFTGSTAITFDVLAYKTVMMNKVTVKAASTAYSDYEAYKNDASKVTVTYGKGSSKVDLVEAGLATITYPDEVVIGKNNVITVTAKDGSGFYGSKTVKLTVTGTKLTAKAADFEITGIDKEYPYSGKAIEPVVVIKDLKRVVNEETGECYTLVQGTDYTVSYSKNVNAGTAKVIITGKGAYTGKVTKTFKIQKETMDWADALANILGNLF